MAPGGKLPASNESLMNLKPKPVGNMFLSWLHNVNSLLPKWRFKGKRNSKPSQKNKIPSSDWRIPSSVVTRRLSWIIPLVLGSDCIRSRLFPFVVFSVDLSFTVFSLFFVLSLQIVSSLVWVSVPMISDQTEPGSVQCYKYIHIYIFKYILDHFRTWLFLFWVTKTAFEV